MCKKLIPSILLLLLSLQLIGQDCSMNKHSFEYDEKISYTIYYHLAGFWVETGDVYFKVDSANIRGEDYFHFNSYGSSFKRYDWIYKVRDSYEAYTSKEDFKPYKFNRKVNEGSTHIREFYTFNHQDNEVYTKRQTDDDEPFVKDTIGLKGCSFDVLSMIYYARNIDFSNFKEGDKVPIKIFIDNESHESYIRYLGKKDLKIKDVGEFRCILFSPLLLEGTIFNAGEGMTVWVTDDQNKVPLLIETPILVGSIKARVRELEGLKYPLTSKIATD